MVLSKAKTTFFSIMGPKSVGLSAREIEFSHADATPDRALS